MIQQLNDIKDYLLTKYSQFHAGFANVEKPSGTDIVMDENGNYCGISDNKGNYFFIRSLKESRFEVQQRNCRPQYYRRSTNCRLISIMNGVNNEQHEMVLIEAVSRLGHAVTRTVTDRTQVFFEETGTRNITDGLKLLSLILVDFEVIEIVNAKDCKLELCEC